MLDNQVDAIIQRTLREEIASDVTVLIIAHRLQTVVSLDKVVRLFFLATSTNLVDILSRRWY